MALCVFSLWAEQGEYRHGEIHGITVIFAEYETQSICDTEQMTTCDWNTEYRLMTLQGWVQECGVVYITGVFLSLVCFQQFKQQTLSGFILLPNILNGFNKVICFVLHNYRES